MAGRRPRMAASRLSVQPCPGTAMVVLWAGILHRTAAGVDGPPGRPAPWRPGLHGHSGLTLWTVIVGSAKSSLWHVACPRRHSMRLRSCAEITGDAGAVLGRGVIPSKNLFARGQSGQRWSEREGFGSRIADARHSRRSLRMPG
jgi:hypothetical protein